MTRQEIRDWIMESLRKNPKEGLRVETERYPYSLGIAVLLDDGKVEEMFGVLVS